MKQTIEATTKAVEEFTNLLEAIGAGACSVFNECSAALARQINNSLEPLRRNEEKQAERWAAAFERLDAQQQKQLNELARQIRAGMRKHNELLLSNLEENLKRHREAKR